MPTLKSGIPRRGSHMRRAHESLHYARASNILQYSISRKYKFSLLSRDTENFFYELLQKKSLLTLYIQLFFEKSPRSKWRAKLTFLPPQERERERLRPNYIYFETKVGASYTRADDEIF